MLIRFASRVVQLTLVLGLLATLTGSVTAAAGDLDPTFGSPKGFVTTDISTATDVANAVAIQADGKIIAAGYSSYGGITAKDFTLVRYSSAGVPDVGFGLGGKVVTSVAAGNLNDLINAIALQADGNIVVAGPVNISGGKSVFGVARYLSLTGALDPSFGAGGLVTTSLSLNNDIPTAIAIQGDQKIVVGGSANANFAVARYRPNGALDTATFGAGLGFVTTDFGGTDLANALVIQPADGKIILGGDSTFGVTGRNFALARYTSVGGLDPTFNSAGTVVTNFHFHSNDVIEGLALQSTGKIVAAGYSDSGAADVVVDGGSRTGGSGKATADPVSVAASGTATGGSVQGASGGSGAVHDRTGHTGNTHSGGSGAITVAPQPGATATAPPTHPGASAAAGGSAAPVHRDGFFRIGAGEGRMDKRHNAGDVGLIQRFFRYGFFLLG